MSYYIDIIDTLSPETKLVIEQASASGIVLKWNGGDEKDALAVVSSDLQFDMLSRTAVDAAFINFFTGDERRFHTLLKDSETDAVVWQGYILPDLYSEPYKNGAFFVSFGATDGLGRLKGKYLPDEFYSLEKSVIDIYCNILSLLGLEMNLYFSPAIENFKTKDWNEIFIDTEVFIKDNDRVDAYSILETLLKDTLCVCYQADNHWYIEGLNVRQFRYVDYKVYNIYNSSYITLVSAKRLLKNIIPFVTPTVTMIPPYNEIIVSHKKTIPAFPKTISAEENDGWAIVSGVIGEIYSSDWIGHGGMLEKCLAPNYSPQIFHRGTENNSSYATLDFPQDDTRFLSLRKKIFYKKGQRINIYFEFNLEQYYKSDPPPSDLNVWKNAFKYEILFNGVVLYSNYNGSVVYFEELNFDAGGKSELSIDHIFAEEGFFDVKIYGLTGIMQETNLKAIIIKKAEIKVFGFIENQKVVDVINGEFSVDKKIELTYADDTSGMSNAFRLKKIKEGTNYFVKIDVPVLYPIDLNGKKYNAVQLAGANLIKENRFNVYSVLDDSKVNIIDVFYNFNNGEEMTVETAVHYPDGFYVHKYASDDVDEYRLYWEQWADVVYKIEKSSYAKIVANINRRIFNTPVEKMDLVVNNPVKFNDIILFKYVFEKDFFVLNCSWNLDDNKTGLTLGRSFYKDVETTHPEDKNIPPIVLAGEDIYIIPGENTVTINATAYDPDGFIVNVVWTKEIGGFGDIITSPNSLSTVLSNLTEDHYRYKIEVTDNDGDTATDYIDIYRVITTDLTLDLIQETTSDPFLDYYLRRVYKLNFNPSLPENAIISLSGLIKSEIKLRNPADAVVANCQIKKNGVVIIADVRVAFVEDPSKKEQSYSFNCTKNDEILVILDNHIKYHSENYSYSEANIGTYSVVSGNVVVVGLPMQKTQSLGTP